VEFIGTPSVTQCWSASVSTTTLRRRRPLRPSATVSTDDRSGVGGLSDQSYHRDRGAALTLVRLGLTSGSGVSPYRPKTAFRREVVRKVDLSTSINTTRRALHCGQHPESLFGNMYVYYYRTYEIGYIFVSTSPFFSLKI